MNPGSAVQFATANDGWRLDGQDGTPHLDDFLGAGPVDSNFDYPGDSVSDTADGGQTWGQIFTDKEGIWGIDLLSPSLGWIVSVTSVSQTTDGGTTWIQVGEPDGESLVAVDFTSADTGYGLTTTGQMVESDDGGNSWKDASLSQSGTSLCFASQQVGYVSDGDGNIFTTKDAGATWAKSNSPISDALAPFWSQLSCAGENVWQGLRVLDPNIPSGQPYVVSYSADQGATWSVMAAASSDPAVVVPAGPNLVGQLTEVVGTNSGATSLIGFPESGWDLQIENIDESGNSTAAKAPSLPGKPAGPAHAAGYLEVYGASFIGSSGWVLLNDNAVGPPSPATQSILLGTTDGGASWSILNTGAVEPPPPYPTQSASSSSDSPGPTGNISTSGEG